MSTRKYYTDKAKEFFDSTVSIDMGNLYQPFLELMPQNAKILDAGCGSGRDSLYFMKKGFSVTAFDYSKEMVQLSSDLIGKPVLLMSFDDINFDEEFDGIWACASLIHVGKKEMKDVIEKLIRALKPEGILYASFKYGDKEEIRNDRLFSDFTETSFQRLISEIPSLELIKSWKTADVRADRKNECWFNILMRRTN